MTWQGISFDWTQVRAFLATAETGSLSAAARDLGLTQPTVGRQITALERSLRVELFDRTGRALSLTPAGLSLLGAAREMGEAAGRLSMAASGQITELAGPVSLTASDAFCAYWLPKVLARLRADAPGLRITVVASNRVEDLRRRAADIAIRHVRPTDPDLIARKLRDTRVGFYAHPDYLASLSEPLNRANALSGSYIGLAPIEEVLPFLQSVGLEVTPDHFPLMSESGVAGWEMVRAGLGIGLMLPEIATLCPDVEEVLTDLPVIEVPIWLVTHRDLQTSRRIRHVFDTLVEAFTAAN